MTEQTFHDRVTLSIDNQGIARVAMIRSKKYNALDWDMFQGLIAAAKAVKKNPDVRAVILHGEGPAFSAGLDFASFTKTPGRMVRGFLKYGVKRTNLFQEVAWCWRKLPVPVIAVLHGHCYGGGMQIALAADFRIAAPDCELSVMEVKWGLIPDMTGSVTLRELVPMDVAKELTMTGRILSGNEAAELNLVTRSVNDPMAEALELARALCSRSPDAVSAAKSLFHQTWTTDETSAFDRESGLQLKLLRGRNHKEAVRANFAKRDPGWGPRKFRG